MQFHRVSCRETLGGIGWDRYLEPHPQPLEGIVQALLAVSACGKLSWEFGINSMQMAKIDTL